MEFNKSIQLITSLYDVFFLIDGDYLIQDTNLNSSLQGLSLLEITHSMDRAFAENRLKDLNINQTNQWEARILNEENEYNWFIFRCLKQTENDFLLLGIDINDTKITHFKVENLLNELSTELEEQILMKGKLEEEQRISQNIYEELLVKERLGHIGQFTSGIIHEINNPLNYIINGLYLLQKDIAQIKDTLRSSNNPNLNLSEWVEIENTLDQMKFASNRIKTISDSVKSLAFLRTYEKELFNLDESFDHVLLLLEPLIAQHDVKVHILKDTEPIVLLAFGSLLTQAFLNIVKNGIEAMEGIKNPQIRISLNKHPEKEQVIVIIKDNGKGMAPKDINQLFKPFITSKPKGKGLGLGMYITKSIVDKHKGTITVESKKGKGTTFTLFLPTQ